MNNWTIIGILVAIVVGFYLIKRTIESNFVKISSSEIEIPMWEYQNENGSELSAALLQSNFPERMESIYSSISDRYRYYDFNE
jgi:uncharacterized membrane protein YgaE (UPF0421/DUF939 family)